jgi:hypothetical protein
MIKFNRPHSMVRPSTSTNDYCSFISLSVITFYVASLKLPFVKIL